jgi:CheY-like chemotaxis protein
MGKMKSILLVEDNEDDVDLTLLCIKKNQLAEQVDVVRDGAEALDFIFGRGRYAHRDLSDEPAVILLDLNLPKISGLDVLTQIRNNPKTKRLPVVVFTTSNEERDVAGSYSAGANSYIRKPVDLNHFNAAIQQVGRYWIQLNQDPPPHDLKFLELFQFGKALPRFKRMTLAHAVERAFHRHGGDIARTLLDGITPLQLVGIRNSGARRRKR